MKFVRTGQLTPNPLAALTTVEKPLERTQRITLNRVNHLLSFIGELGDQVLQEYIQHLIACYQKKLTTDSIADMSINFDELIATKENLILNRELAYSIVNFHLQTLGLPADGDWAFGAFEIPQKNYLQSVLIPAYFHLDILAKVVGRKPAFQLYKRFISNYLLHRQSDIEDQFESVEALFNDRELNAEDGSDWVMVHGILEAGKYAYKNENCLWVEALAEFPDSEIVYHVCCYGDYQGAKFWNKDFVLTMEHTIAQGQPYCSRVVHDTRVNWILEHPSKDFWDQMKP